ncbi:MAG: class I SAM-dependent methyltransferase [Actinomycetota bacterium]|nr:class I SAM-dependent methyltransferase [Actinomycetota bacterium]
MRTDPRPAGRNRAATAAPVDIYTAGLGGSAIVLRYPDGSRRPLPVEDYTAVSLPGDAGMLARCDGPTLDVGCGPGRLTAALAARGVPALGIDITPAATSMARGRGALALTRSVFDSLPGTSRWSCALLADGNIGIGGHPVALLRRLRELLSRQGRVILELDPPDTVTSRFRVRLEGDGRTSGWFPWAAVGADDIDAVAAEAGLVPVEHWTEMQRWFAVLSRPC